MLSRKKKFNALLNAPDNSTILQLTLRDEGFGIQLSLQIEVSIQSILL